jgi:hypothetical protein
MIDYGLMIINNYWDKIRIEGNWPYPYPNEVVVDAGETKRLPYFMCDSRLFIPRNPPINITDLGEKIVGEFSKKKFGVLYQYGRHTCELRYDEFSKTSVVIEIGTWGQVSITAIGDGEICKIDAMTLEHLIEKKMDNVKRP